MYQPLNKPGVPKYCDTLNRSEIQFKGDPEKNAYTLSALKQREKIKLTILHIQSGTYNSISLFNTNLNGCLFCVVSSCDANPYAEIKRKIQTTTLKPDLIEEKRERSYQLW